MKKFFVAGFCMLVAATISSYSYSQTESDPVKCLVVSVIQTQHGEILGKKCFRDAEGPDIFEGYEVTCYADANRNCNPAACKAVQGCYVQ